MIHGILFDIDGVLLDSFEAGLHFVSDILVAMGHPKPARKEFKIAFHLPLTKALQHLAKAELTEELERLHEIVPNISYRTDLLSEPPRLKETLETLQKRYALGIVTSRNNEGLTKRYFPFSRAEKYFSVLVTRDDCPDCKPNPGPLLLAAKRLKLKPNECVYVGDGHVDIEAANAAGMKSILFGGKKDRRASAAVRSFARLPESISKLN